MTWYDDQPVVTPPPAPEPAPSTPRPAGFGLRRGAIVAALGALLLVGGGVAAVSAASPEPSTDPSVVEPDATTQPDVLYTFVYRADTGTPQDVMKKKLDLFMKDARVTEH